MKDVMDRRDAMKTMAGAMVALPLATAIPTSTILSLREGMCFYVSGPSGTLVAFNDGSDQWVKWNGKSVEPSNTWRFAHSMMMNQAVKWRFNTDRVFEYEWVKSFSVWYGHRATRKRIRMVKNGGDDGQT